MSTLSQQPFHVIGRGVERRDGMGHVTGTTEYVDDVRYPGMLHLKMVRNPLVHARIKGIDLSEAEKVPTHWVSMIKHTLSHLGPAVSAERMLRDYVQQIYA